MSDRNLDHFVCLDDVVLLDVVVVLKQDAALEAGRNFTDVVLEAAQLGDAALVNLAPVAGEPCLGATADQTVGHVGAGDVAFTGNTDDLTHGGVADDLLLELGFDLTADHALDVFDQLVDDLVRAQRDALPFGGLDHAAWRVDAER